MTVSIPVGEELGPSFSAEADAVVVGSGAGGAVATHALAEAGLKVICVEEGPHVSRERFSGRQLEATRQLYRLDGMTAALGTPSVVIPMGCSIGGTTTINAGTSFRTPERLLRRWGEDFGHTATPDELAREFEAIERLMPIAPVPDHLLGGNSEVVRLGASRLGWSAGPIPRNAPTCRGCCRCVLGCPEDAKLSMNLSFVPAGLRAGAIYLSRLRVRQVLHRAGTAHAVAGDLLSADGRRRAGRFEIRARAVVLAAGAIFTPILLRRSGLQGASRHLGRHLRLHPATRVVGLFDRPVRGWEGVLQGYFVDEFAREGVKLEGVFVPPGLLAPALPFFGVESAEVMRRYENLAVFGAMAEDDSPGGVDGELWGLPRIRYRLTQADANRVVKGAWAIGRIFFAAGARAVYTGIHGHERFDDVDALERLLAHSIPPAWLELLSMHPHGTVPMAADPGRGAVDLEGRVFGTQNLWVADGSLFPTALGVNPQLTIMAYARRVAQQVAAR
ncbi:MAG: GMC family oxidoreductase [Myxococcales bacterium]|nr:GMC family oxidoreductase [Myxococcales bacterium]